MQPGDNQAEKNKLLRGWERRQADLQVLQQRSLSMQSELQRAAMVWPGGCTEYPTLGAWEIEEVSPRPEESGRSCFPPRGPGFKEAHRGLYGRGGSCSRGSSAATLAQESRGGSGNEKQLPSATASGSTMTGSAVPSDATAIPSDSQLDNDVETSWATSGDQLSHMLGGKMHLCGRSSTSRRKAAAAWEPEPYRQDASATSGSEGSPRAAVSASTSVTDVNKPCAESEPMHRQRRREYFDWRRHMHQLEAAQARMTEQVTQLAQQVAEEQAALRQECHAESNLQMPRLQWQQTQKKLDQEEHFSKLQDELCAFRARERQRPAQQIQTQTPRAPMEDHVKVADVAWGPPAGGHERARRRPVERGAPSQQQPVDAQLHQLQEEVAVLQEAAERRLAEHGDDLEAVRIGEQRAKAASDREVGELRKEVWQQQMEQRKVEATLREVFELKLEELSQSSASEQAAAHARWKRRCAEEMRESRLEREVLRGELVQQDGALASFGEQEQERLSRVGMQLEAAVKQSREAKQEAERLRGQLLVESRLCKHLTSEAGQREALHEASLRHCSENAELEQLVRHWHGAAERARLEAEAAAQSSEDAQAINLELRTMLGVSARREEGRLLELESRSHEQADRLSDEMRALTAENRSLQEEVRRHRDRNEELLCESQRAKAKAAEAAEARQRLADALQQQAKGVHEAEECAQEAQAEWSSHAQHLERESAQELQALHRAEALCGSQAIALQARERISSELADAAQRVRYFEGAESRAAEVLQQQLSEDMDIIAGLRRRSVELSEQVEDARELLDNLQDTCKQEVGRLPRPWQESVLEGMALQEETAERAHAVGVRRGSNRQTERTVAIFYSRGAWCAAALSKTVECALALLHGSEEQQKVNTSSIEALEDEVAKLQDKLERALAAEHGLHRDQLPQGMAYQHPVQERTLQPVNAQLEQKINLLQSCLRPAGSSVATAANHEADQWSLCKSSGSSEHRSRIRLAAQRLQCLAAETKAGGAQAGGDLGDLAELAAHLEGLVAVSSGERQSLREELQVEAEDRRRLVAAVTVAETRLERAEAELRRTTTLDPQEHTEPSPWRSLLDCEDVDLKDKLAKAEVEQSHSQCLRGAAPGGCNVAPAGCPRPQQHYPPSPAQPACRLTAERSERSSGVSQAGPDRASPVTPRSASLGQRLVYPPSPPDFGGPQAQEESLMKPDERTAGGTHPPRPLPGLPLATTMAGSGARSAEATRSSKHGAGESEENAAEVFSHAEALCAAGRFQEATPLFRRLLAALQGSSDSQMRGVEAEIWAHLGVAMQSQDDIEAAIESYRTAVRLDPLLHVCFANLARLYQYMNNSGLAQESIARALRLEPTNAAYLDIRRSLLH